MTSAQTKLVVIGGGALALLYWLRQKTAPLASTQIGSGYLPAIPGAVSSLHPAIHQTDPSAHLLYLPNVGPVNGDLIAAARAAMAGDDTSTITAAPSTVGLENDLAKTMPAGGDPGSARDVLPSVQIGNGDFGPIDGSVGADFTEDPNNDIVGDSITIVWLS